MPLTASLGAPAWTGGVTWNGLGLRQFWAGTKTADHGTAAALAPAGGVYPGGGSMKVTPGAGLGVAVSAGYCCVPHPTPGAGAYIFGAMVSEALTLASNSSGSMRIDLVVARVLDLGSSGSSCDVEVVTGTPGAGAPAAPPASVPLAQVAVVSGASSISSGNITDRRAYTVPPGCVLPIASAAAAPAAGRSQIMFNIATGLLCAGTGTAGQAAAVGFAGLAGQSNVNTSAGQQGKTPGTPSSDPWGIGYGEVDTSTGGGGGGGGGGKGGGGGGGGGGSGGDTDGTIATELAVTFSADGVSDYEFHYKWGLAIPAQAYAGGTQTITAAGVTVILLVDGGVADSVSLLCASSPLGTSGGGSASWFTSGLQGTTLSAGLHTAQVAVETSGSFSSTGPVSGVLIGDVAASGPTVFGAAPGYCAALTEENCLLRVSSVPAS